MNARWTDVYTDGACSGNPGPGGWAWVVPDGPHRAGAEGHTTNQRMEIRAVLEALTDLDGPLHVHSDSTYVVNCFKDRWYEGWLGRDWRNSQRKPVANRDLWEPLLDVALPRMEDGALRFSWVKGHSGDPMNDLADRLAVAAIEELRDLEGAGRVDNTEAVECEIPWPVGPALVVVGSPRITTEQAEQIRTVIRSLDRDATVVSGLRRGAELVAAEEAIDRRLPLAAVLPFDDPARNWPEELRARFDAALARAAHEVELGGDVASPAESMRARNRWLERAALGALVVGDPVLAERYRAAGLTVIEIA